MRPRVQRAPGLPCALYFFEGKRICKPRARRVARMRSDARSNLAVILRCAHLRASKDGVQHRTRGHPSRLAEGGSHLRMTAVVQDLTMRTTPPVAATNPRDPVA